MVFDNIKFIPFSRVCMTFWVKIISCSKLVGLLENWNDKSNRNIGLELVPKKYTYYFKKKKVHIKY